VREMEDCWLSGVGLSGAGVKPPCAALAEDRRGERQGKGVARSHQVGTKKTFQSIRGCASGVVVEALLNQLASKPGVFVPLPG
jgi:hypothetical protein